MIFCRIDEKAQTFDPYHYDVKLSEEDRINFAFMSSTDGEII